MASFMTWTEWLKVRESNARKRAVRAALNGTGTELPGSYAVCPSTNPAAMKVAKKKGVVGKFPFKEGENLPDYSFDRWIQQAKEFGDDINKIRKDTEKEEKKLDDKEKEVEKKTNKAEEEDKKDEQKDKAWKRLQDLHHKNLESKEKDPSSDKSSSRG